jgi:hypothetical protein
LIILLIFYSQKYVVKMSEDNQKLGVVRERYGLPVYRSNPSVPEPDTITKKRTVKVGNDKRGFVVDTGNGDILSVGGMGFYEFEEVDETKFVKLFLSGMRKAAGLSKAGLAVFELVYNQVQNNHGTDEIKLNAEDANMPSSTFRRGVRELLEKEFLYQSLYQGVFFINIRYMFNGDRLAFVKGYKRKSKKLPEPHQPDLFDYNDSLQQIEPSNKED